MRSRGPQDAYIERDIAEGRLTEVAAQELIDQASGGGPRLGLGAVACRHARPPPAEPAPPLPPQYTHTTVTATRTQMVMKLRIVRQLRTPEYDALFAGDPTWCVPPPKIKDVHAREFACCCNSASS